MTEPFSTIVRGGRQRRWLTAPVVGEAPGVPATLRAGLLIAAALLSGLLGWASLMRIDAVVVAAGEVLPSGQVRAVVRPDGGVVAEVLVAEGQKVAEGDVLVRLDPVPIRAELDQTRAREALLLLRAERLAALIAHRKPDFAAVTTAYPNVAAAQEKVWTGQLEARRTALDALDAQIETRNRDIRQLKDALAIAQQQLKLAADQASIRSKAVESGVVSRQVYLETARAKVTAEAEVNRLAEQVRVAGDTVAELHTRRASLDATQEQEAQGELATVNTELEQVKATLARLQERIDHAEVRAPTAGLVQGLRVHATADPLPADGLLLKVVPTTDALEADLHIAASDIGAIRVGQPVRLKVPAYDAARYGTLSATLTRVSAATTLDSQGRIPMHRATVRIERPYLGADPGQYPVMPGMAVEADIVTGDRPLIAALFAPAAGAPRRSQ